MKPAARTLCAALMLLGTTTAGAAHAGTVYVPVPGVTSVGNATYDLNVFVTNGLTVQRPVKTLQFDTRVDGTERDGLTPNASPIPPGRTVILRPDGSEAGLLELQAVAGMEVSARLVGAGSATGLGVELPVITSENIGHGGDTLVVQTLRGSTTVQTGLVLLNLSPAKNRCSAAFKKADGTPTGVNLLTLDLVPLSHYSVGDIFSGAVISEARVEVKCDGEFFAYAQMTDAATGEFAIAGPSGGSDSAFSVPGETPALACAAGSWCHIVPGLVHQSTGANPDRSIVLNPPVFAYSRVRVHLEVEVNGFAAPASGAHGVLYFVRDGNKDMYANIFLRGGGKNDITLRHGFNQTHGAKAKIQQGLPIQEGGRYHFDYLYDPVGKLITLTVSLNGQVVTTLHSKPNVNRAHIDAGHKVIVGLSNPHVGDPVEPASVGWRYHNLLVEFTP